MLDVGEVVAQSEFQKQRLTAAVTAAQVYLSGTDVAEMGKGIGRTAERAAQLVRLGLSYMLEAGWLRPADRKAAAPAASRPRLRGPSPECDRGLC